MQERGMATRLRDNGGGVVTANVVEGTQDGVVATDDDDRFTGDSGGHELPRIFHLIGARDELPRLAEHAQTLDFGNARIDIPGCGDGRGLRQRGLVVVTGEYPLD